MSLSTPPQQHEEHEESFFVSMTDMMVGMLFLFIIMLMFFAMKFSDDSVDMRAQNQLLEEQRKEAEAEKDRLHAQLELLQGAQQARKLLVEQVYTSLKKQGVAVMLDEDNGILRLPESILFAVGRAELSAEGRVAVAKLAQALSVVLPCYTTQPGIAPPEECQPTAFGLEALLIEGHTDTDGAEDLNWRLSMERAFQTYQIIVRERPALANMCSRQTRGEQTGYPLLSVAGYGFNRPVAPNTTAENKRLNRRIDIRFLMAPPNEREIDTARRLLR